MLLVQCRTPSGSLPGQVKLRDRWWSGEPGTGAKGGSGVEGHFNTGQAEA